MCGRLPTHSNSLASCWRSSFGLQVGFCGRKSGSACVRLTLGEVLHFRFEAALDKLLSNAFAD